jgi:hypothetical protein
MGLDTASVQLLCAAKAMGVNFSQTATIGRQSFWPGEDTLSAAFSMLGVHLDPASFLRENPFGDRFLTLLGAKELVSVDYSDYESADVLQDMNVPLKDELRERFSLVHDGGTIEHVFNVYQAFKNCMEMVRLGGHFTQVGVANNYLGHGFWQFSPEMIFRAFSAENGYKIEAVFLHENVPGGAWYQVTDPDDVRTRVELCNSCPTYIMTIAKRVAIKPIFARAPQQSDYVPQWQHQSAAVTSTVSKYYAPSPAWWRFVPSGVKTWKYFLQRALGRDGVNRGFNPSFYKRIEKNTLLPQRAVSKSRTDL